MSRLHAMTMRHRRSLRLHRRRSLLSHVARRAATKSTRTWQTYLQRAMAMVSIRSEMLAPSGMQRFPFQRLDVIDLMRHA